jgi:hypothetical protein
MRLNNWSIAASYHTGRLFAGLGFGSAHREWLDHLAPAPHPLVLRQHIGVRALLVIDPAFQAARQ